jgi:DNA replication and repair protein RecF
LIIKHLTLTNFRNYASLELDLPPNPVVIRGDNAQGKSNLLEAIYLLATSRSPRTTTERELIRWGGEGGGIWWARLQAEVKRAQDEVRLEIALQQEMLSPLQRGSGTKKRIRINGIVRRAADLVGQVKVVMFSPQDIEIIGGAPTLRRRYLDITNSQVDRAYLRSLQHLQRVLGQRNRLLRLILDGRSRPQELHFWDGELVEKGCYLMAQRQQLVAQLSKLAQDIHHRLTQGREKLEILYLPSLGTEVPPGQAEALAEVFHEALERNRRKEIAQGVTLVGPHRDDIQFQVNGVDMGRYGSRGQQRTIVLALKLAEASFIRDRAGDTPVLLLDDFLSELDRERRRHLQEAIVLYEQVIITATDLEPFEPSFLAPAAKLEVRQGAIQELEAQNP